VTAAASQPAPAPIPDAPARADSLAGRLLDVRTLVSFVILAFLLLFVITRVQLDYRDALRAIGGTNFVLYGLAFGAYYTSYVVRAVRWEILLRNAGEAGSFATLLRIVLLAFFANCVLPAKMGDFYRAYLLRERTQISGAKGLGTIVSERVIDFLVLMALLLLSAAISFQATVPSRFLGAFALGAAIAALLVLGLIALQLLKGRLPRLMPGRLRELAHRFQSGLLDAFGQRLGLIIGLSVMVWVAESARLYLVVQALPFHTSLHLAQVMFIALVASLLTTIPALPGGLVLVEGGIIAVLAFFGLSPSQGLSVAILDRLISYWSLIVVGLGLFLARRR